MPRVAPGARPTMRRWSVVVGGLAVAGILAILLLYAVIRTDLPERVASHWGTDGVDATQTPRAFVTSLVLLEGGIVAFLGMLSAALPVEARRILGATAGGLTGLFVVGIGGSLYAQRGLTDPYAAQDVGGWIALGLAAGVVLAGLIAWLLPTHIPAANDALLSPIPARSRATGDITPIAGSAASASDEDATVPDGSSREGTAYGLPWSAPVPPGTGGYVVIGLLALLALGLAATPARWIAAPVILAVGLLVFAMTRCRVLIDADGVRVRGFGITWLRAPAATISSAEASTARPMAEFGGYGLRYSLHGRGFVTTSGPALRLRIPHGTDTWISVREEDLPGALAAVRQITEP